MGDGVIQLPRFFVRTVLIVTTWVAGAAFTSYLPDEGAERRADELAPAVAPPVNPQNLAPGAAPGTSPRIRTPTRSGRPSEAPPLVDPPSPAPV